MTSGAQGNDVNSVTAVAISGSTVELTITNNIKNDEVVRVGYNDPSGGNDANAIQDASGNDADSLSPTAVTNNSTMAGSSPVYVGSTTSSDGTKVILTYNEALSATTAATSAFTVTSGGAGTVSYTHLTLPTKA